MQAAIIGAGVIGCGWAARFLLHGWDTIVFDPDATAPDRVTQTLNRARAAVAGLYDARLPAEGQLSFVSSPADAVATCHWVQESLPEILELKLSVYQQLQQQLPPQVPLASSTSGFKPTLLASGLTCARQLLVCHPFNPVYLVPAVEVVAGVATDPHIVQQALEVLQQVGMKPIEVGAEVDAHIADRLMEALWREALWLVADGVATTTEIDDVMRYGFGLRWAQMGLFETYRLGGGEAGMRHFLKQFAPALNWPWSKLTDVPNMDNSLVEKIAQQSDQQSGHLSIDELTELRDRNLVAILQALKQTNSGAGELLNQLDAQWRGDAKKPSS